MRGNPLGIEVVARWESDSVSLCCQVLSLPVGKRGRWRRAGFHRAPRARSPGAPSSDLTPRYTFQSFVVGTSNQAHLLHAVGHEMGRRYPRCECSITIQTSSSSSMKPSTLTLTSLADRLESLTSGHAAPERRGDGYSPKNRGGSTDIR